jgi:uncharacterized protein (DUF1697 family)
MPRYVALFRGINVGKAKRVAMADLRVLLAALGFSDVHTLLNSGNAVFSAPAAAPDKIAARIRAEVTRQLGVDALAIVKSAQEVAAIIRGNVLIADPGVADAAGHSRLLVAMAQSAAPIAALKPLAKLAWGREQLHVGKHAAYLWCADGILESRVAAALLGKLPQGTTRNWATLGKIHALLQQT